MKDKNNPTRPPTAVPTGLVTYEFSGRPIEDLCHELGDWLAMTKDTVVLEGINPNIANVPHEQARIFVTVFESSEVW